MVFSRSMNASPYTWLLKQEIIALIKSKSTLYEIHFLLPYVYILWTCYSKNLPSSIQTSLLLRYSVHILYNWGRNVNTGRFLGVNVRANASPCLWSQSLGCFRLHNFASSLNANVEGRHRRVSSGRGGLGWGRYGRCAHFREIRFNSLLLMLLLSVLSWPSICSEHFLDSIFSYLSTF